MTRHTHRTMLLGVLLTTLFAQACAANDAPDLGGGWVLLGERHVADRVEHDTISVTGAQGDFSAIKLLVRGRAVQFHDLKIHFKNGGTQDAKGRHVIPAGGESRVIDLVGPDRVIQSVEFVYDAQTRRRRTSGGATVLLYGRR